MKLYLLNGSFTEKKPIGPAFKEVLDAHHAYWGKFMAAGNVLFSGPKVGDAGLIILKCDESMNVEEIVAADPFVTSGTAVFTISEFHAFYKHPSAEEWFK